MNSLRQCANLFVALVVIICVFAVNMQFIKLVKFSMQRNHNKLDQVSQILYRMRGPLSPNDPELIELIRKQYLIPPSFLPYNFSRSQYEDDFVSTAFIASITKDLFDNMRGGFFVEAGALDGEYMANTITLEKDLGWNGLLVEPDQNHFAALQTKHRKAWSSPTCLSINNHPEEVLLSREVDPIHENPILAHAASRVTKDSDLLQLPAYSVAVSTAQCFPASSLLSALNVTHIDLFVLDIERVEWAVLKHFPLAQFLVDVWAIEHATDYEDKPLIEFMILNGYYYFDCSCIEVPDYIFVRKSSSVYKKLKVPPEFENRTEVCAYKQRVQRTNVTIQPDVIRDHHHYPNLEFKEIPRLSNFLGDPYYLLFVN